MLQIIFLVFLTVTSTSFRRGLHITLQSTDMSSYSLTGRRGRKTKKQDISSQERDWNAAKPFPLESHIFVRNDTYQSALATLARHTRSHAITRGNSQQQTNNNQTHTDLDTWERPAHILPGRQTPKNLPPHTYYAQVIQTRPATHVNSPSSNKKHPFPPFTGFPSPKSKQKTSHGFALNVVGGGPTEKKAESSDETSDSEGDVIMKRRTSYKDYDYYVHYVAFDRRLDKWEKAEKVHVQMTKVLFRDGFNIGWKLPATYIRDRDKAWRDYNYNDECEFKEEHLRAHQESTKVRNFEYIVIGKYRVQTWYFSPIPLEIQMAKSDTLWFCDFCLNYFAFEKEYNHHMQKCTVRHPPGNEIYRSKEHNCVVSVFEVDGGKETVSAILPLIIGGQKGLVEESDLRIPNMRGIMMARKKPLTVVEPVEANIETTSVKFEKPAPKGAVKLVSSDNLDELVNLLHNEAKVI